MRHLETIVEREPNVEAILIFGVPMSHLRGVPSRLRERFSIPVIYYDPDVPMSLPEFGGMDTGFNIYHGADPGEYDLVLSNSEGGLERLRALGASRADHLFWGADPEVFSPRAVDKRYDVFFYGYGLKFRREWTAELLAEPSRRLPHVNFAVAGADLEADLGRARRLGYVMPSQLPFEISSARINLNIVRRPHASVPASSTSRLFELAACGATIVTSPYAGVERWFEPGPELIVVHDGAAAVDAYRMLLDDPGAAAEIGRRARERVLAEHTSRHRALRLLDLIGVNGRSRGSA